MKSRRTADATDLAILRSLIANPDATGLAIAEQTGLARNTIRSRLTRYAEESALHGFEHRIDPTFLGHPLRAYVIAKVVQRKLDLVAARLNEIPEVLEALGVAGVSDVIINVVARDADDLYRIAGAILAIEGVKRTETGLVMRELVKYRVKPLLEGQLRRA